MPSKSKSLVPQERVLSAILLIRGEKVILDATLAELYSVETRTLVQAVKRNIDRFPEDFMFQLTSDEFEDLKSQSVTSSGWGGRRREPYAFTEQGIAMLSSVLRSPRAVKVNVEIMRAFVRLRRVALEHEELILRIDALEERYDKQFGAVFDAIRALISDKTKARKTIGFGKEE